MTLMDKAIDMLQALAMMLLVTLGLGIFAGLFLAVGIKTARVVLG